MLLREFGLSLALVLYYSMMSHTLFKKNHYTLSGVILFTIGVLVTLLSYFVIMLTWLTALGFCMLILSFIMIALGMTISQLPPEVCSILMETSMDNMAKIVEELGVRTKAIYLPSSLAGGKPQALIPLQSHTTLSSITHSLPARLVARYGANPDDIGLLLSTPGTAALNLLSQKPGPSSSELESALSILLVGTLGVADKVRLVNGQEKVSVEILHPTMEQRASWCDVCLGKPLASIVATVLAEAWNRPITIIQETYMNNTCTISFEVRR